MLKESAFAHGEVPGRTGYPCIEIFFLLRIWTKKERGMIHSAMKTCSDENCPNQARSLGLCPKHYQRLKTGSAARAKVDEYPECSVSHCVLSANSHKDGAFCDPHYQKAYRGFDPEMYIPAKGNGTKVKFNKVCRFDGCQRAARGVALLCISHVRHLKSGAVPGAEAFGLVLNDPCSFPGCVHRRKTSGALLCHSHSDQERRGEIVRDLRTYGAYMSGDRVCQVSVCRRPAIARGLCERCLSKSNEYRLEFDELDRLLSVAECENPGCRETRRLNIDHDHQTGKVRGMLCASCNTALGHMKEDVARIRGLATYKETHA